MSWNTWLYADRLGEEKQTTKPQTNADRIRAMTDEELAEWLCSNCGDCNDCVACKLCNAFDEKSNGLEKWLKQPAEVE